MIKIQKPIGIITSLGRTGTKFFAEFFSEVIPDITSFHEPDIFHLAPERGHSVRELITQISTVGVHNLVFKKIAGRWSIIEISDRRISGMIDDEHAIDLLIDQRKDFINNQHGRLYIESNAGFYGLIDLLPSVFENQRVIYIIRDGRDWVTSKMNWGEMYNKSVSRKIFGHTWLTAPDYKNDQYANQWEDMSRFERLCWAWAQLNRTALDATAKNPNTKVIKFENIFYGEDRYHTLNQIMDYLLDHPSIDITATSSTQGWLETRIHKSSGSFPSWQNWSEDQMTVFDEFCQPLMEEMDYYG